MGLIDKVRGGILLSVFLFLASGNGLFAQNPGIPVPGQLGAEIQELERRLTAGVSLTERYETLTRLARLRQLSGDIAGAAACWLDAAAANPSDETALVTGVYCLAAIGEWEKAQLTLLPLLSSGRQGTPVLQARYLNASLRARSSNDISALAGLANDPDFAPMYPLIYYSLWRIISDNPGLTAAGSAESWKARLLAEFPKSPEARSADSQRSESASVSAVLNPFWMLFPGMAGSAPVAPLTSVTPSPGTVNTVVLQTGVFSREANAQSQAEAIRKAGFPAMVSVKLINGVEHWAVTVPAGLDSNRTAQDLKKAGFDSFPVK